jgi:hypothetical protein
MLFSFVGQGVLGVGVVQSAQDLLWVMFLRDWVEELCVVQAALNLTSREKWCAAFLKADTSWDWVQCSGA